MFNLQNGDEIIGRVVRQGGKKADAFRAVLKITFTYIKTSK
jgi:hypothetical protein